MSETRSDSRPRGTLRRTGGERGVIRMEDVYDTDIEDLWSAITDPERLARWLVEVEGDLRVGGEITTRFTSSWTGAGRIEVCEAPRRLQVALDQGDDDETVVEAVLVAEGERTRLVVEERGLSLIALAGHGAGWQAHLEDLVDHLAGREAGDWHERWVALTPGYDELLATLD